jgi:hypothetical protein
MRSEIAKSVDGDFMRGRAEESMPSGEARLLRLGQMQIYFARHARPTAFEHCRTILKRSILPARSARPLFN